jgi:hypothetical protein
MTALYVFIAIVAGLAGLTGLILALAVLLRAFAALLPPATQALTEVAQLREWNAQRRQEPIREPRVTDGIAPAPVLEPERRRPRGRAVVLPEGPTSADLPPVVVGDVDRFDEQAAEEFIARPIAPASRHAAAPPGEPVEGEEGYRG